MNESIQTSAIILKKKKEKKINVVREQKEEH